MGVKGLWSLLNPVARPVQIESLEGKRLAIDSSIWLYQFQSTMRDKDGRVLVNAHVLGFLRRINKLLFHGIKPVFVFDGGAPALKRSTIAERKRRKAGAAQSHAKMAEKLLHAQMRREAVRAAQEAEETRAARSAERASRMVYEDDGGEEMPANVTYLDELERGPGSSQRRETAITAESSMASVADETPEERRKRFKKHDRYYLPDVEVPQFSTEDRPDHRLATEQELQRFIDELNPGDIDIDSPEFRQLPTEAQYEIIGDLRIRSRQPNYKRLTDMLRASHTALDFSKNQIKNLSQRNSLTQQLLTVTDMVGKAHLTIPVRVAAERNREYVLVKRGDGQGWALGIREGMKDKPIEIDQSPTKPKREELEDTDVEELDDEGGEYDYDSDHKAKPMVVDEDLRKHRRQEVLRAIMSRYTEKAPRKDRDEGVKSFGPKPAPGAAPLFDPHDEAADATNAERTKGPSVVPTANDEALALALQQEELGSDEDEPDPELAMALALSRAKTGSNGNVPRQALDIEEEARSSDSDEFEEVSLVPSEASTPAPRTATATPAPEDIVEVPDSSDEDDFVEVVDEQPAPASEQPQLTSLIKESIAGSSRTDERSLSPAVQAVERSTDRLGDEMVVDVDLPVQENGAPPSIAQSTPSEQTRRTPSAPPQTQPAASTSQSRPLKSSQLRQSYVAAELPAQPPPRRVARLPSEESMEEVPLAIASSEDEFEEVEPSQPEVSLQPQVSHQPGDSNQPIEATSPPDQLEPVVAPSRQDSLEPVEPTTPHTVSNRSSPSVTGIRSRMAPSPSPPPSVPQSIDTDDDEPASDWEETLHNSQIQASRWDNNQNHEDEDYNDDDDDEPVQWSRSPTPEQHSRSTIPTADASFQSDSKGEDDGGMAPADMVDEEDDYARFLAQIQNRNLNEVRSELDDEIRALHAQTKAAMRDADEISQSMVVQIQTLLRHFGIPYITAPMEAEAQCATLASLGLVDGIITDDSDVFLFGGAQCFKNIFNDAKFAECFLATDIERELSLDRDRLVSLSYLLGSDYTLGLPGVGPVLALELLANFPGPRGLQAFKEWWLRVQMGTDLPVEADTKWKRAFKKRFGGKLHLGGDWPNPAVREAYLHPTADESAEPFHWGFPRLAALRTYLHEELSWSISKVDDELTPIVQRIAQRGRGTLKKQATLMPYFDHAAVGGNYAPRRRTTSNVSKRLLSVIKAFREAEAKARGQVPEGLGEMLRDVDPEDPSGLGKRKRKSGGEAGSGEAAGDEDGDGEEGSKPKPKRAARKTKSKTASEVDEAASVSEAESARGRARGRGRGRARGRGRGRGGSTASVASTT